MKLMLNGKEVSGMGHYVMAGDIKDATAEDSNVLSSKTYYNNNGKREGTMPNRGGMSAELTAGGSVSIPEGYHNGEGVVRAQDLASQTQGTAAAANIEAGYTAWVNGVQVTGTMANSAIGFEVLGDIPVPNSSYSTIFTAPEGTTHLLFEDYYGFKTFCPMPKGYKGYTMLHTYDASGNKEPATLSTNMNGENTISGYSYYIKSITAVRLLL